MALAQPILIQLSFTKLAQCINKHQALLLDNTPPFPPLLDDGADAPSNGARRCHHTSIPHHFRAL
jgi:hypothetical protein